MMGNSGVPLWEMGTAAHQAVLGVLFGAFFHKWPRMPAHNWRLTGVASVTIPRSPLNFLSFTPGCGKPVAFCLICTWRSRHRS